MSGQKIERVLGLLQSERNNRRGKRCVRIGEELLDAGDVGFEDILRAVDELADFRESGDGQGR